VGARFAPFQLPVGTTPAPSPLGRDRCAKRARGASAQGILQRWGLRSAPIGAQKALDIGRALSPAVILNGDQGSRLASLRTSWLSDKAFPLGKRLRSHERTVIAKIFS